MSKDENGNLHSFNDLPAKEYRGNKEWYYHVRDSTANG